MKLVLSLMPGIDMLGLAFKSEGFCVVQGGDLIFGGDVRTEHYPPGKFDGVISGPPCQAFSRLRYLVEHNGYALAQNLIPEFERCVHECQPQWFIMENVPAAPLPHVDGYMVKDQLVRDVWVGGYTDRLRRFSFGTHGGHSLQMDWLALHCTDPNAAVLASGGSRRIPVAIGGSGKRKRSKAADLGYKTQAYFANAIRDQGLPEDFDLPGFTVAGKIKAIGNGVPLPMGRAIAKAVIKAITDQGP